MVWFINGAACPQEFYGEGQLPRFVSTEVYHDTSRLMTGESETRVADIVSQVMASNHTQRSHTMRYSLYPVQASKASAGSAIPPGWEIVILNGIAYYVREGARS